LIEITPAASELSAEVRGIDLAHGLSGEACRGITGSRGSMASESSFHPFRFLMDCTIFNIPGLNFIFRSMKAIPVAPAKLAPQLLAKAYDEVEQAFTDG
jgi:hypothetical protein